MSSGNPQIGDYEAADGLLTVTFIMLCHDSAERVISRARKLLEEDPTCKLIVHFDRSSARNKYRKIREALRDHPRCHVMNRDRVRCGWGTWGLVEAPLRAIRFAFEAGFASDYFYLISEYCYPVQPLIALRQHLTKLAGTEFIECQDSSWIKGGIREDRYLYRHYLDKRKHPKLHRWMYRAQKNLGMDRKVPFDLEMRFGSQWWCLSCSSISWVSSEKKYMPHFKRMWIPDESFFQTLIYIRNFEFLNITLTYAGFDDDGKAVMCNTPPTASTINRYFFYRKVM